MLVQHTLPSFLCHLLIFSRTISNIFQKRYGLRGSVKNETRLAILYSYVLQGIGSAKLKQSIADGIENLSFRPRTEINGIDLYVMLLQLFDLVRGKVDYAHRPASCA